MARVSLGDTPTRQDTNQQRDKRTPQTSKEQAESVSKEETEQECDECDAKGDGGWERKICVVNDGTGGVPSAAACARREQQQHAAMTTRERWTAPSDAPAAAASAKA